LVGLLVNARQVLVAPTNQSPVVINEFLAANWTEFRDEDGDRSDWIELYNRSQQTISLAGWTLSDDPNHPEKWTFPDIDLSGQAYLVVFASNKDRKPSGPKATLHTNFKIDRTGGYLALHSSTSRRFIDAVEITYPRQERNISYGHYSDQPQAKAGGYAYFDKPTPGQSNDTPPLWGGSVAEVQFSLERGFYETPFTVTLSTTTPAATIRYTNDGSEPTATHGYTYTTALPITRTAFIRAVAFKPGHKSAPITTHSYIFPADILAQWWMTEWAQANPDQAPAVREALLNAPSLSIVTDLENYDIYYQPYEDWERPVSVELIPGAGGGTGFQVNAGITLHGHTALEKAKKSFRLFFRDIYGASKLRYPLFPDSYVTEFNTLILRGGGNRNFTGGERWRLTTTYGRDEWLRVSEEAMTGLSAHGIFVNLYLNGQYWGVYNLVERPDAAFVSTYLGGDEATWYSHNHWGSLGGDKERYQELEDLVENADFARPEIYERVKAYLDPAAFADHMILNWYAGNEDWPHNNWYIAQRNPAGQLKHFSWDGEVIWVDGAKLAWEKPLYLKRNYAKPLFDALMQNPDFRLELADRIYKHLFNGGLLTTAKSQARWLDVHHQIERAIPAEIARWGDEKEGVEPVTLTTWVAARDDVLAQMEGNSEKFITLAREAGYYPLIDPPVFNQQGGLVAAPFTLSIYSLGGTIYYTTDGSDPRLPAAGTLSPTAHPYTAPLPLTTTTQIKARVRLGDMWSALNEAVFRAEPADHHLSVTEIMYHPQNGEDYEFLELQNTGNTTINLSNMAFEGINFSFPQGKSLDPGQFVVLVRDPAAFAQRYPDVTIDGVYTGKLSNSGERLILKDITGQPRLLIDYDDQNGWPLSPDGHGDSLVIIDPGGDSNDPQNWRASPSINGSPGN